MHQVHQVVAAVAVDNHEGVVDRWAVAAIPVGSFGVADKPCGLAGTPDIPADKAGEGKFAGEDRSAEFADSPMVDIDFGRKGAVPRAAEGAGSPEEEGSE